MGDEPVIDFAILVDSLEKRPQILMPVANYDTIVAYLYGFDWAFDRTEHPLNGFREFLLSRIDNCQNLLWSQVIDRIAKRDGKDARTLLFQLLKEFLKIPQEDLADSPIDSPDRDRNTSVS